MNKLFIALLLVIPSLSFATTANFGYETQGTSGGIGGSADWARCSDFTSPTDMVTIDSITIYVNAMGATGLKPVIWLSSDESVFQVFPAITSGTGWQTSTLGSPVAITGGTVFCLGWLYGDSDSEPVYDTGGFTAWADVVNSYASPQSFDIDDTSSNSISLYATGTLEEEGGESSSSTATTTPLTGDDELFIAMIIVFLLSVWLFFSIFSPNAKK